MGSWEDEIMGWDHGIMDTNSEPPRPHTNRDRQTETKIAETENS